MKITLTHNHIKSIEIDVTGATKDNLKQYVKKLQEYTKIESIYPWYISSDFNVVHTGSWLVNKDNNEVLKKLESEFAFIQNAINCHNGQRKDTI